MKRVAAQIADKEPPIDVLINNAGALFGTRRLTEDGLEHTFALNHMSYFVVTEGLRERFLASGAALHGIARQLMEARMTARRKKGAAAPGR
jgi:NAD(P)-dependent dehydrogenase (short-subunit alcohol dehydrogenase family)